jgi:hypothetical protein
MSDYLKIAEMASKPLDGWITQAPPKREWVGLTDEEVEILIKTAWNEEQAFAGFVRSIEAKLKEKNGG